MQQIEQLSKDTQKEAKKSEFARAHSQKALADAVMNADYLRTDNNDEIDLDKLRTDPAARADFIEKIVYKAAEDFVAEKYGSGLGRGETIRRANGYLGDLATLDIEAKKLMLKPGFQMEDLEKLRNKGVEESTQSTVGALQRRVVTSSTKFREELSDRLGVDLDPERFDDQAAQQLYESVQVGLQREALLKAYSKDPSRN